MHSVYFPLKWVCPNLENFKKDFKNNQFGKKQKGRGEIFGKNGVALLLKLNLEMEKDNGDLVR